jgi:hypothetical protein
MTVLGQRYVAMRQYFNMAKVDFNWKSSYGILVPKAMADKRRAKAVEKAIR